MKAINDIFDLLTTILNKSYVDSSYVLKMEPCSLFLLIRSGSKSFLAEAPKSLFEISTD